jgi:hypothetical protein
MEPLSRRAAKEDFIGSGRIDRIGSILLRYTTRDYVESERSGWITI